MNRIQRSSWPKAIACAAVSILFAAPAFAGYDVPPPELL